MMRQSCWLLTTIPRALGEPKRVAGRDWRPPLQRPSEFNARDCGNRRVTILDRMEVCGILCKRVWLNSLHPFFELDCEAV